MGHNKGENWNRISDFHQFRFENFQVWNNIFCSEFQKIPMSIFPILFIGMEIYKKF